MFAVAACVAEVFLLHTKNNQHSHITNLAMGIALAISLTGGRPFSTTFLHHVPRVLETDRGVFEKGPGRLASGWQATSLQG